MATKAIRRIFVGNLPWTVGHRELRNYFSEFGHVISANVIFDRNTGMSRGYGFVVFSTPAGFEHASNKQTHILEGTKISVQAASN